MKYLSKAQHKLDEDDCERLQKPLLLSHFEKSALVSVLKETISKIVVVNSGSDGKIVELPTSKPPMHVRFNKPILDRFYNEETLEPLRECFKAMSISKLESDIEVIRFALEMCCKDIENGAFRNFAEFIFSENREAYDEYSLLKAYCENIEKLEELHKELKHNRKKNEDLILKLDEDLFNLKTECENREKTNRFEANMVKKWENARQEQVDAVFNHELKTLYQSRDDYEEKTERELVVINEILAFYRAKCTKLEDSIKSWQQRYETERIELDEQIKHTEDNIEDVKSKYELIRHQYEERAKFIEEYYIEQKQLEEIRKMEASKQKAATKIQAWWRGTMVRKQLGPYRPKKKSKKPKAAKKK
ncbi:dynein regulatory complex protein 9 [Contarinia nasturtii]|uniref:dynein regulatory complex protein 9 n=1 Tax=Contarinia nasturtii TaxID=265458 RepID=UPI0012D4288F|nr:dynein regulatory complex protein 9 [Contarinia nasturtii]